MFGSLAIGLRNHGNAVVGCVFFVATNMCGRGVFDPIVLGQLELNDVMNFEFHAMPDIDALFTEPANGVPMLETIHALLAREIMALDLGHPLSPSWNRGPSDQTALLPRCQAALRVKHAHYC